RLAVRPPSQPARMARRACARTRRRGRTRRPRRPPQRAGREETKGAQMTVPYQQPLVPLEPGPRQIPEPPRRGEEGGPPCAICGGQTTAAVWSDDNWTLHPPVGGSLPGSVWLAARVHADSFSDLPDHLQQDFGRVAARVERAILSLGDVAR